MKLPLSFMAAFFAINIDSFAFDDNGKLPLGYVSKYMCRWPDQDFDMVQFLTAL